MPRRSKFWRTLRFAFLTVALLAAGFTLYLDFRVRSEFEGRRFALPARIYARPLELHAGLRIAQGDVVRELREAGYREEPREGESGWFVRDDNALEIAVRPASEVLALVRSDPFGGVEFSKDLRGWVAALGARPRALPPLPLAPGQPQLWRADSCRSVPCCQGLRCRQSRLPPGPSEARVVPVFREVLHRRY